MNWLPLLAHAETAYCQSSTFNRPNSLNRNPIQIDSFGCYDNETQSQISSLYRFSLLELYENSKTKWAEY